MSEELVINFNKVTKTYKLFKDDKKRLLGLLFKNIKCKENKAVNNVSFVVKKGEGFAQGIFIKYLTVDDEENSFKDRTSNY